MQKNVYPITTTSALPTAPTNRPALVAARSAWRMFLLLCVLGLGLAAPAQASHFRYGDIAWRVVQSDVTGRTIEFKVNAGWRLGAANAIGLNFGDGTSGNANIVYANISNAYDYGTGTVQHRYNANGNFTVSYSGCCKISNLQNNANGNWYVSSVVNVGGGNSSPVSTVPAVVNMSTGLATARYIIPAADPDGRALTFSLAGAAQSWPGVQPGGLSINSQTGEITFNTVGKATGQLWNVGVAISNGRTTVVVDFIIQIVQPSNPPRFDYSITPANQRVFNASPGQNVSFSVRATDIDAGSTVRLNAVGVPPGTTISPAFGVYANPVQHAFSWTPAANQFGTFVVNFVAESNLGSQVSTSVTIIVSLKPRFDVPPTPAANVPNIYAPGQTISQTIQASDADPTDLVRIINAEEKASNGTLTALPAGAGLSPMPTTAANPTSGTFSWTPAASSWGKHTLVFTAEESRGERMTHEVGYLINTVPVFTSVPVTRADVGQPYAYAISANDPDLTYGDAVNFVSANVLPAWLTLTTDPAAGTAVLAGTPPVSAAGTLTIRLLAEDVHHHEYPATPEQVFTIVINNCTVQAVAQDVTLLLDANGQASVTAAQVDNGSTASCGVASVQVSPLAFSCANTGANPVTLTVTDVNGNVSTAAATVTVIDGELPTITAPTALSVSADAGQCSAALTLVPATAADNCSATVTSDAPATFPKGLTTVTWTATDAAGNIATATQEVTVMDNELPTITAPVAVGVSTDPGQCSATGVSLGQATIGDNCAGVTVNNDAPATFAKGTTTVTWTATAASGNRTTATQVVTVNDNELPTITAPAPVSVSTDAGQCSATGVALGQATTGDNCAGVTVSNNAPASFAKGATTVTWTATDAAGNSAIATQVITVTDNERPMLTVPANIVVNAPATQCGATATFAPTATDNCAGATVVASPASGSTFAVGTTTVNVTATDASGNVSTGSFTVTVNDVTAPAVVTRNVTVTLVNGTAQVTADQVNNGSTDACGIASISLSRKLFSCATLGANPVILTVTDVHGNVASASAVVTVVGSIPTPTILVTPSSSVYTGGVATSLYLGYGAQSATLTASGGVSYVWSPATGLSSTTIANPVFTATTAGTFTYTVLVTNQYGCTATQRVTLRVVDARCGSKVVVCHGGHEICISPNAVPTHLTGHTGDQLGACGTIAARSSAPVAASGNASTATELSAYPNPAADLTTVSFRAAIDGPAQVVVYNELGQRVATLYQGTVTGGQVYELPLRSQSLATGLYMCQLVLNGKSEMLRLVIAR